ESCSGSSSDCPADAKSTAVCRSSAGQCDVAEQCDGVNVDCPANNFQPSGTACNDGSVCTQTDQCNGGGLCVGSNLLDCNDHNACTADSCDAVNGCQNPPTPATSCKGAAKAILILKQNGGSGDKQLFKWVNGDTLTLTELADPTGTTAYGICIYSGS